MRTLLCALAVVAGVAVALAAAEPDSTTAPCIHCCGINTPPVKFNNFVFARDWAPSVCQGFGTSCNTSAVEDQFIIHGLWPNFENGTWPQFCNPNSTFNASLIADLSKEMAEAWPGLQNGCNDWFYGHEWDKHGTCAAILPDLGDEHKFFKSVLELAKELDYDKWFAEEGIKPSHNVTYSGDRIMKVLTKNLGALPTLQCTNGTLESIWICVGIDLKPCDCPIDTVACNNQNCPQVLLPPKSEVIASASKDTSSPASCGSPWPALAAGGGIGA